MTKPKRKATPTRKAKSAPAAQREAVASRPEPKPVPDGDPAAIPAETPEVPGPDARIPPDHQMGERARGLAPDQEVEERARESNPPVNPDDAQH